MYFDTCQNLNELKKAYKSLAMKHHPDMGGDEETMKTINVEYDLAFTVLKSRQNAEAERPDSETRKTTETPEEFCAIVSVLLGLAGIEVELCGAWLWISGETYQHRETLKAAGCLFSGCKKRWYWRHAEDSDRRSRGKTTMKQIRRRYGSEWLQMEGECEALPA